MHVHLRVLTSREIFAVNGEAHPQLPKNSRRICELIEKPCTIFLVPGSWMEPESF